MKFAAFPQVTTTRSAEKIDPFLVLDFRHFRSDTTPSPPGLKGF